jgi:hypothetical protein
MVHIGAFWCIFLGQKRHLVISLASGYAIEYYMIKGVRVPVWFWGEEEMIIPTSLKIR